MEQINLSVAVAAGVVVLLGLVSKRIQNMWLSRPLVALAVGVAAGPVGLNGMHPHDWPNLARILQEVARFALAISVFGIALRTPEASIRRLLRSVALLLTLGMAAMWAVSAGLAWGLLGAAPLMALAVGAAITPTDPVVASSIVTGSAAEETLPDRLRSTLSLESGANDGLAYPIVVLPILLMQSEHPWSRWLVEDVLVGVGVAVAMGGALGWAVGWLVRNADRLAWIERLSLLSLSVALSLLAVTGAKLLGSDGILAAFAAGLAFRLAVDREEDDEDARVQEAISKLFNLPVFVLLGAALPWSEWTLGTLAFALLVLLLRRPLALALCGPLLGTGLRRRDAAFLGWFGPVGVAALYYAMLVEERTGDPAAWHAASLTLAASVLLHGVTSWPGLLAYGRAAGEDVAGRGQAQSPSATS